MPLTRRATLSLGGCAVVAAGVVGYAGWREFRPNSGTAAAQTPAAQPTIPQTSQEKAEDQHKATRSIGSPTAKVTVTEFFSLTCIHCAGFAHETMPEIEKDLIQPGKVRFVFHDFPLDQVALTGAMVARYLPPAQYYPFVSALFASQDRWAFARGVDSKEEIWKVAALAGMSRSTFDAAVADVDLKNWILQQQQHDQDVWKIDSTPSFVIDGKKYAGEMSYDAFRKLLPEV
jgi:protein-disulfide isomerase